MAEFRILNEMAKLRNINKYNQDANNLVYIFNSIHSTLEWQGIDYPLFFL